MIPLGENDTVTKESGLKQIRIDALRKLKVWRALTPRKGNPKYGVNDQVHKIVHRDMQNEIYDAIGFQKAAQKRPTGPSLQPGGKYVTAAGNRSCHSP